MRYGLHISPGWDVLGSGDGSVEVVVSSPHAAGTAFSSSSSLINLRSGGPPARNTNALKSLSVREDYETAKIYERFVTRTLLVGLRKNDLHHFISNCALEKEIPTNNGRRYT